MWILDGVFFTKIEILFIKDLREYVSDLKDTGGKNTEDDWKNAENVYTDLVLKFFNCFLLEI